MGWFTWTCRCGQTQQMPQETYEHLKRSSQTFHCVWGHHGHYPQGPSSEDKLRLERDRLKQDAARLEDEKRVAWSAATQERERAEAAERRASAARGQVTKLKKRAANGVCPCCNRQFINLQRHMATKHAGFMAEDVAPDGVTVQ